MKLPETVSVDPRVARWLKEHGIGHYLDSPEGFFSLMNKEEHSKFAEFLRQIQNDPVELVESVVVEESK